MNNKKEIYEESKKKFLDKMSGCLVVQSELNILISFLITKNIINKDEFEKFREAIKDEAFKILVESHLKVFDETFNSTMMETENE